MTKKSNIVKTKDGFVEKSSGRKIESPLDVEKYKYFVSYQYVCPTAPIFGNAEYASDTPIKTYADVKIMTKIFKERDENKYDIVILNWIRLADNE